ncbi:hypothetical protein CDAR_425001 [Caerostris darwini]|uniref:Uncharacterized protein n=1 Tax=Caerostris darwini TaxID=1538125 RepID=A0AAV4RPW7_9ARAC|nr:hypothetical protein CDAR_425001 [Caerostris darwini]
MKALRISLSTGQAQISLRGSTCQSVPPPSASLQGSQLVSLTAVVPTMGSSSRGRVDLAPPFCDNGPLFHPPWFDYGNVGECDSIVPRDACQKFTRPSANGTPNECNRTVVPPLRWGWVDPGVEFSERWPSVV